jgi:hypothetical protein
MTFEAGQAPIWQSIATAPRDGTPVLLFHPAWDMLQVGLHDGGTDLWQQPCGDLLPQTPTHWTMLPPLPQIP